MGKTFLVIAAVVIMLSPLAAQSITVTSPAAGVQWCQGTGYAITWTSTGVSGPVAIKLRLANAPDAPPVLDIVASMGNAGTYTWPVPASIVAGAYVVRVRTASDSPLVYDDSDAFLIKACQPPAGTITVTAPAPGAEWCQGSSYAITWTASDVAGPMSIKLFQAGVPSAPPLLDIVASTGNAGTYTWPVPASVPAGAYLVRVRPVSESMVYDDSDAFTIKACSAAVVSHLPDGQLPPIALKFPRLEVSEIDLTPNTEGFGIVFNYKNVGGGALPKAAEVPVKPNYRVLIDGKETASGSLFIPAFAAQPGWEQKGYFGGWIVLPSSTSAWDNNWFIGNTITVHINENKALGMDSHTLTLPLKPIALKYKYDLVRNGVSLDWQTRVLTVFLRLDGNVPAGREVAVWCGSDATANNYFEVRQHARPGTYEISRKVDFPSYYNKVTLYLHTVVVVPDVRQVEDMDFRNHTQLKLEFTRPDPDPVM